MTERVVTTVRFEPEPWAALERYVQHMRRAWPRASRNQAINHLISKAVVAEIGPAAGEVSR